MDRRWMRVYLLASIFTVILASFFAVVRPWYLQWGASDAEARMRLPGDEIKQVALWTITFALVVVSAVQVLRRREWKRPLAGFVGSGLVFQVLTLGQPPVVLGVALLAVVAMTTSVCPGRGNFPHPARSSLSTHARAV